MSASGISRRSPAVRSIFLSDLHLGLNGCRADLALAFLKATPSAALYLVGDIFDLWVMRRRVRWEPTYNKLLRHILKRAQRGERVVYVPGNHDAGVTALAGLGLVNIEIASRVLYEAVDGRRLLVIHGHEADSVVNIHPTLARVGTHAYDTLIWLNAVANRARAALGLEPWRFSRAVKRSVKRATMYIGNFEQIMADSARALGAHGVICGHIHQPVIRERDGLTYMNCGDWVEHCTALVEHWDGQFQLVTHAEPSVQPTGAEQADAYALAPAYPGGQGDAPATHRVPSMNAPAARWGRGEGAGPPCRPSCGGEGCRDADSVIPGGARRVGRHGADLRCGRWT